MSHLKKNPTYSFDLVPCDCHLFRALKQNLDDYEFKGDREWKQF